MLEIHTRKKVTANVSRFGEISVLFWALVLVTLWVFRNPSFIWGWGELFKPKFVSDDVSAMAVACVLFAWPKEIPDIFLSRDRE